MILQLSIVIFTTFATCIGRMNRITYTCNFNDDQCGQWTSTSSTNKWIRVTRSYNSKNLGKNSETVMESSVAHKESAKLESLLLPPGNVKLEFTSMSFKRRRGRLRVFRKWNGHMDRLKSVRPKYRRRSKTIHRSSCQVPWRVVFEAYGATGAAVLHIDDVTITVVPYPAITPAPENEKRQKHRDRYGHPKYDETFYCHFDQNKCQNIWFSDESNDFDWVYRSGSSRINDTGPLSGYGDRGYYMVMEAQGHQSGQKARLLSKTVRPGVIILFFRHSMYGDDVGRLRVYKKVDAEMTVLWTRIGPNDTRAWRSENITFQCNSPCRVVFEAERGVFEHGDIAIDEVLLFIAYHHTFGRNSIAVLRDVCDFEVSFCNWVQATDDTLRWERWRGATPNKDTGPLGDYTREGGAYALFQNSSEGTNRSATMTSHVIRYPIWRELSFVYHKLQYDNNTSRLNVYKKLESTGVTELLWSNPQVEGEHDWQERSITVNSNAWYFLVFEAVGGCCGNVDIAVDNVEITSGILPEISDCEFNNSLCRWTQSTNDDFNWVLNAGDNSITLTPTTGPQTNDGPYVYTDASYPRMNGDVAILDGPAMGPLGNASICVRFTYYMYGRHVGKLQLTRSRTGDAGEDDRLLWTRSGNQGQRWWSGYVTLPFVNDDVVRLRFKSVRGSGIRGDIAIKNVVTDGKPCHEDAPYDCDFTVDMCEWEQSTSAGATWTRATSENRSKDASPPTDHTTGSKDGGYMIATSAKDQSSFYITVKTSKTICVNFWYFSYGKNGPLTFWTQPQNSLQATIKWSFNGEVVTWQHAEVSVQSNVSYKIGFQAGPKNGYEAIDDIRVTHGPCAQL